jgi:glycosyltransferase involved in cell wall biosynthesis
MNDVQGIDIAVAGKFHAYQLASEYAALGRLRDLYSADKSISLPDRVSRHAFHNRVDLAIWERLCRYIPLPDAGERKLEIFDDWVAASLARKTPGILHSWNGNSYNTFRRYKGSGWRLCVERSCPHNQFQYEVVLEEGKVLGIPHVQNMRLLDRAIEELHLADVIIAPSSYSASSYKERELADKVRINPLGTNVDYHEKRPRVAGLRVLMVGNGFLRKGTHYLIEAFKLIDDQRAELWIRGEVPEAYRKRIQDPRVTIIPPVLRKRLRKIFQAADVFVQPSIDEGFGMTVLEALGYGLPLVITENVGARELLSPEVAITVPIRDPEAIAAAIEAARHLRGPGFDLARRSILEKNTWAACAQRMVDCVYVNQDVKLTSNC